MSSTTGFDFHHRESSSTCSTREFTVHGVNRSLTTVESRRQHNDNAIERKQQPQPGTTRKKDDNRYTMKGFLNILVFLQLLLFVIVRVASFPTCNDGDTKLEETCDVFGDKPLTWNLISFGYLCACLEDASCNGNLAGVRCISGDGFTSRRYNRWECLDNCTFTEHVGNPTNRKE